MSRSLKILVGVVVVALCIGAPVAFAVHMQAQTRNFAVVQDGVLYRSGQITMFGLKNLLHEYRIRTVVTLRGPASEGEPAPDQAEEDYCLAEEINYVRLPPAHWESTLGPPPVEPNVETFRQVMSDPANYPVLIHCFAGIHRTGAYCAVYHMEHDHWSNDQAVHDLIAHGYYNLPEEKDILGYLRNYQPTWERKQGTPPRSAVIHWTQGRN
jgi:protein tyrosine/serine phosphatase